MHEIKAIETRWKGYRFRSRLEARWAVFFESLGVRWEYEREGYDLDGLKYLPDFWLPKHSAFVEIKPKPCPVGYEWNESIASYVQASPSHADACNATRSHIEYTKAHRLVAATRLPVFMLFSDLSPLRIWADGNDEMRITGSNVRWRFENDKVRHSDGCCSWGECPICGMIGFAVHGHHDLCEHKEDRDEESPRILQAYGAARSARFEHGESPI